MRYLLRLKTSLYRFNTSSDGRVVIFGKRIGMPPNILIIPERLGRDYIISTLRVSCVSELEFTCTIYNILQVHILTDPCGTLGNQLMPIKC
jgi:hypothetical protein